LLESKKKKIVVDCFINPFPTELSQRPSWGDSIVGNKCLEVHKQKCVTIKNCDKKVVSIDSIFVKNRPAFTKTNKTGGDRFCRLSENRSVKFEIFKILGKFEIKNSKKN
jgi:hypothetical protein